MFFLFLMLLSNYAFTRQSSSDQSEVQYLFCLTRQQWKQAKMGAITVSEMVQQLQDSNILQSCTLKPVHCRSNIDCGKHWPLGQMWLQYNCIVIIVTYADSSGKQEHRHLLAPSCLRCLPIRFVWKMKLPLSLTESIPCSFVKKKILDALYSSQTAERQWIQWTVSLKSKG